MGYFNTIRLDSVVQNLIGSNTLPKKPTLLVVLTIVIAASGFNRTALSEGHRQFLLRSAPARAQAPSSVCAPSTICGKVTDAETNTIPLNGIVVELRSAQGVVIQRTFTDVLGLYSFTSLASGSYSVKPVVDVGQLAIPALIFTGPGSGSADFQIRGIPATINIFGTDTGSLMVVTNQEYTPPNPPSLPSPFLVYQVVTDGSGNGTLRVPSASYWLTCWVPTPMGFRKTSNWQLPRPPDLPGRVLRPQESIAVTCPPFQDDGQSSDLSIAKVGGPDPVRRGANLTYTITATNNGPNAAESILVTDNLPPETTFVSCSSTGSSGICGGSGNNRTVMFTSLAAGQSGTITIVARVNDSLPGGTRISNTATVTSAGTDPDPNNNSATQMISSTPAPPTVIVDKVRMSNGHTLQIDVIGQFSQTPNTRKSIKVSTVLNNTPVTRSLSLRVDEVGPQRKSFLIDLTDTDVPRFTENQFFKVEAIATEGGMDSEPTHSNVVILLPVVIVPGIQPTCLLQGHCDGGDGTYEGLERALKSESQQRLEANQFLGEGYRLRSDDSDYPTLYTISYHTNQDDFITAGLTLQQFIESVVKERTFANRVNLVTHSKGGLVARQFLFLGISNPSLVSQLIMCAPPNLGSLWALLERPLDLPTNYQDLYPLWKWKRSAAPDPYELPGFPDPLSNPDLTDLNKSQLPSAVPYAIIYSASQDTRYTLTTFSQRPDPTIAGDGVVPWFSQLGKMFDPNFPNQRTELIPAFQGVVIDSTKIDGEHAGYTDLPTVQSHILSRLFSLTSTPSGVDVIVQLGTTTLTFSNITTSGITTITPIAPSLAGSPPIGFTITGPAWDVRTTAMYSGPITACFSAPADTDQAAFSRLRVLHREGDALVDRTTSQDFAGGLVCSSVTSLSPFVVARATPFDICLQDDSNGDRLQLSSSTGEYQFTRCGTGGFILNGSGSVTVRGSQITLQHNSTDRRVLARFDNSQNRGTASLQLLSRGTTFTISDRNTTNNTCGCH